MSRLKILFSIQPQRNDVSPVATHLFGTFLTLVFPAIAAIVIAVLFSIRNNATKRQCLTHFPCSDNGPRILVPPRIPALPTSL